MKQVAKTIRSYWKHAFVAAFAVFLGVSWFSGYKQGIQSGREFVDVITDMLLLLPCAFVLIALFEVWVKRETVERHLGSSKGVRGYFWAMVLGGMTVGGAFVAFPLAYTLHRKGASLPVIFCFLGFAGVCRIPMTIFEITFLGWKFTLVRLSSAIILLLISGIIIGSFLERRDYEITEE